MGRHVTCNARSVERAVALVFEADWALRELLKRTLREAGFEVLESSTFVEFDLRLRLRALRAAGRALLVLGDVIATRSEPSIRALAAQRVEDGLGRPQLVVTREMGALPGEGYEQLGDCNVIATLEKPFDLSLLQAMAFRFRTASDEQLVASAPTASMHDGHGG